MKHKTTIPELIQKAGWWGGLPPVIGRTTGWVTRSDWSKPHKICWHNVREGSPEALLLWPKS